MKSMMLAKHQEILVLGWMADGSPIYPMHGCDSAPVEGETGGEGSGGETAGGTGETGETGETGDPAGAGETGAGDPTALAAQIEMLTRRLMAADKSKGEFERKLREYDDQGKNDLQKAQEQVADLTTKLEKATADATRARLEREILKHPGYIWHDPEVVLALVDMDGIAIDDESGKVTGVNDALKKLAAGKPFLLKGRNNDGGGSGGSSGGGKPAGSSGTNPSGGTTTDADKRRTELKNKYKL